MMKVRKWIAVGAAMLLLPAWPAQAGTVSRIKDIVSFEGVRDNMLIGYGLVVGLNGTGDKLQNNAFTEQSLIAFLERQGVNTRGTDLKTKNVAAVTVTALLPPFARSGARVDVNVSAIGDSKSLQGGTLVATPLYGADGEVYAVAQGPVAISGFQAKGDSGTSITKGVPTAGLISSGAVVEREVDFDLNQLASVNMALHNPDITTSRSIANLLNKKMGPGSAFAVDPGTVQLKVPPAFSGDVTGLLAAVEQYEVETDQPARIVIDDDSGTIVVGENVKIDTVAVAQGNLIVRIEETPQVSQPGPFAPDSAQTVVVPRSTVSVDENSQARMTTLRTGATLKELVNGLNALGVGPRDLVSILQAIKAAGALQAEIELI